MGLWHGEARAASVYDADCRSKLADRDLYKKEKKMSYDVLVPGKDGWIFRSSTDFVDNFMFDDDGIRGLKALSDALKAKGIDLVITHQPTRGIVAASRLSKDDPLAAAFDPAKALASYKASIAKMQAAGLHFTGVTEFPSPETYFRKTDQHWNTKGAEQTAKIVAAYIKKNFASYKDIPKEKYESKVVKEYEFDGRFNDVVKDFCGFNLPLEQDIEVETSVKGADEDALFGDQAFPQVVLIGTSNSKAEDFNANFDGALKQHLGADVYNAAIAGAGYDDPFMAYLNSAQYRDNPPKIIVWEIPGYYVLENEDELFNQLIAAIYGNCAGKELASFGPVKLSGGDVALATGLAKKNIPNGYSYLHLQFDQPVKKNVEINFEFQDSGRSQKRFKFKRSKRYPYDGDFFVTTFAEKRDPMDVLSIRKVPDQLKGMSVKGWFCPLPAGVSGL